MAELTFIIGGTRSGKSSFAMQIANTYNNVGYIATADLKQISKSADTEMLQRIKNHQENRPANWKTVESPFDLDQSVAGLDGKVDAIIIDCITIYITNILIGDGAPEEKEAEVVKSIKRLCAVCKDISPHVIIVTNEVGCGIVPDNPLGRKFRDISGYVNQLIAKEADSVFFVTAGIGSKIK